MKKSDIKILLSLLCIVIVGGAYMYIFKPNMEEVDTIESETETLEAQYKELKLLYDDKDTYEKETKEYIEKFNTILADYPATLAQEKTVMFVKGIDKEDEFVVNSTGLGQPGLFYTISGNPEDAAGTPYSCYSAEYPIAYEGSYEGIKALVDYVMAYPERMAISSVGIAYDSQNDTYSGNVTLMAFCVSGNGRTDAEVDATVPNGVDNIFLGGDGKATITSYKYDATKGAELATDNNIEIILINANNDTTDGIIASESGKASSAISSGDNAIVDVKVKVEEAAEGGYMVECTIGDNSFDFTTNDEDIKIYVKSSERVDDADNNGIKLSIDNSTDAPVFVLVEDDDETSPRFSLGRKTGTVKVY